MKKYWLSFLMIFTILSISIVDVLLPNRSFSAFENRFLALQPVFSIERLLNNEFSSDYQKYVNDQFVGRDHWITLKSLTEKIIGKKENNGIYFGNDNFLFEKIIHPQPQLALNEQYMDEFLRMYKKLPISLIIPLSSSMVYQSKLPNHAPIYDQYKWYNHKQALWPMIDVMNELSASNELVYYRNDHHWSLYGAYLAYQQIANEIGLVPSSWESMDIQTVDGFLGSYYAQGKPVTYTSEPLLYLDPPILAYQTPTTTHTNLIDSDKLYKSDKYSAFLYGNHGFARIKVHDIQDPKKLLVIKDSYANSLLPFFVEHYDQIDVVDLRHYSQSLKELLSTNNYENILFVCSFSQFSSDSSIAKLRY